MTVLESAATDYETRVAVPTGRSDWRQSYTHVLIAIDIFAASASASILYEWRVAGLAVAPRTSLLRNIATVTLPVVWIATLALHRAYDRWSTDPATTAARRVAQAALTLAAVFSSVCLALRYDRLIDHIVIGIPLTLGLTVLLRHVTLGWLRSRGRHPRRRRGLVVGPAVATSGLLAALARDDSHGIEVVAACLAGDASDDQITALTVPVYGDVSDVAGIARVARCDTVIVSPSAQLAPVQLRQLGWDLNDAGIELLVAPALADVATERIAVEPVGGMPLLHVRAPVLSGSQRVLKGILDRIAASLLLMAVAPLMGGIALLVRLNSPGPALFRQRRVGRGGTEFTCLKFRTMTIDAEARRAELAHLNERRDGLLFKIRRDPRITKIGVALRRYSLDELPQLINVVRGDMSLVGPRPPLPLEAAGYDHAVRRRLLVKPGLTGLWQVSGRSELSWAESVRLDLSYVDNWSPALDARILLRTVTAVIRGTGAY